MSEPTNVSDAMQGLDMSRLAQLGCDEDSIGADIVEQITGYLSFRVGPRLSEKYGNKCAVFITFTPEEDSAEDVHTQPYNVGPLWHPDTEVTKGDNKGLIPHQFLPGMAEKNGDGHPIICDVYSEDESHHFGKSIVTVKGTVPSEAKYSAKSGFNTFMKSLKRLGVDTDSLPEDFTILDGRFLVHARRQVAGQMENEKTGKSEDYKSILVDEVISDTPPGAKKSATSDISEDELGAFKVYAHAAITDSERKDDVGRSPKTTLTVALMRAYPGGTSAKYVAALTSEAVMNSIGVEIVADRYGIKEE